MKYNVIVASTVLSLIVSNVNAFSSIKIAFPEGKPEEITIAHVISTGDCRFSGNPPGCMVEDFSSILPIEVVDRYLQSFSEVNGNKLVDNQFFKPNNYMKFTIPGLANNCFVELQNQNDIVVYFNKNGSCHQ